MRSLALTLVSTLLLSPIGVLSTCHGEDHTKNELGYGYCSIKHAHHSTGHEEDHKPHKQDYKEYSYENSLDLTNDRVVKILIQVDIKDTSTKKTCQDRKKSCHGDHDCENKIEACKEVYKCRIPKISCLGGHSCFENYKQCYPKDQSKYGFRCSNKFFSQSKILEAATIACSELKKNDQKSVYPAAHTATSYMVPGPYYEWPFHRTGSWWNIRRNNKNRIILTKSCGVVGAVIRNKKDKSYRKCHYEPK